MKQNEKDKILLLGGAIVDVLVSPAEPEVFVKGSYPAENIHMSFGGDALNEATVLASLGKKVYLDTVLGTDPQGQMIQKRCEDLGITLTEGSVKEGMQTGINVVLIRKDSERNFFTNTNGSLRKLSKEDVVDPFPDDVGILCYASFFVSLDIGTPEVAEVFKRAKQQGITICADTTKCKNGETVDDIAPALAYVDYMWPNEEEAYLITGKNTPEEAAAELRRGGVKNAIVKCGKRGCYILNEEGGFYVPPVQGVKSVDTTGAGDSFAGGFIYGLSEGWDLKKCAEFANQCGAKAVSMVGATTWCEKKD